MLSLFSRKNKSEKDLTLYTTIKGILGKKPKNLDLYKLAVQHSSVSKDSNERLEYLGDAILGAIVAEYLFKKFPYKDEGFLTEIRSRIVKRESLNGLALKIGLNKVLQFQTQHKHVKHMNQSIYGNALEAFIGAIYLDRGYKFCTKFIINGLIKPYINIQDIIDNHHNFKSVLIEWSQKNSKKIKFNIIKEKGTKHNTKEFTSQVSIDDEIVGQGIGFSKKKAEQAAAQKACVLLQILP
ncbi:MAG: ribonuclease III [Cytophagales bacterium]|nr:ribonuclease III [Cytophagales bacterium]